ncbi:hypothetical protein [Deinococcus multiflagellatus]|uniref:Uncharacterized protein n=1 Tax=Deinococcus multiflagellatus TaxID=1656887 RepID=A0ABW1ZQU2_9DEIO|nr:hypothetical protein [Deinococcus multiflagellatus]MBZ9715341.1 hypothetical protein [Deinococcus multiflagellatus]
MTLTLPNRDAADAFLVLMQNLGLTQAQTFADAESLSPEQQTSLFQAWQAAGLITPLPNFPEVLCPCADEHTLRAEYVRLSGARHCRICLCTDAWGCEEGCSWAGPDLCSSCVPASQAQASRATLARLAASPTLRVLAISTQHYEHAQVIAAVVLDRDGTVLLDEVVRADVRIEHGAQAYHGLTADHLAQGVPFSLVHERLGQLLAPGFDVVCWPASFVQAALNRSARANDLPLLPFTHWQPELQHDLMGPVLGSYSHSRASWFGPSLKEALAGVPLPEGTAPNGTTLGMAQRALAVLRWYGEGHDQAAPSPDDEDLGGHGADQCPVCAQALASCTCGEVWA